MTSGVSTATNSQNSAFVENEKVVESISGKINIFNNEMQKLWSNTIDSDFIKWVVDSGTGLVKLADAIGLVNIALIALGGALGGLPWAIAIGSIALVVKGIDALVLTSEEWKANLIDIQGEINSLSSELEALESKKERDNTLTAEQIALLEKEIELKKKRKELTDAELAEEIEKGIPDLQASLSAEVTPGAVFGVEDRDEVSALIILQKEISRIKDEIANFGEVTDDNAHQLEAWQSALGTLEGKLVEVEDEGLDLVKIFSSLSDESYANLNENTKEYIRVLKDLLGIAPQLPDFWALAAESSVKAADNQGELTELTQAEIDALTELADAYEFSANEMTGFISTAEELYALNQRVVEGEKLHTDEIINLISQYPEYASQIININKSKDIGINLTKMLFEAQKEEATESIRLKIKQAEANLTLIGTERTRLALSQARKGESSEDADEIHRLNQEIGSLYTAIKAIEGVDFEDISSFSSAIGSGADGAEAYSNVLATLNRLQHEYNLLVSKADVYGEDTYQGQLEKIEAIKDELERLNDIDRERLNTLEEGTEDYDSLLATIVARSEEWWTWEAKLIDLKDSQLEKEREIAEAKAEQLEADKNAINDLIDLTVELIKQENEAYKDQLETRKDSLALAKKEADLQKELADLNADKADIEDQLFQLRLDGSENVNAQILELEQQLADKETEITEKVEEDAYDKKVQILDDEIEAVDDYLDKEGKLREEAMERINEAFANSTNELYNQLVEYNNVYGSSIESDITNAWEAATEALKRYNSELGSATVESAMSNINVEDVKAQMNFNSAAWHDAKTQEEKDALHDANLALGQSIGATYNPDGTWNFPKYGNGGYVDTPHMAMVGDSPESIIPDLKMGEFLASAFVSLNDLINSQMLNVSKGMGSSTTNIGSLITVNGNIDKNNISRVESAANQVADALRNSANKQGLKNISIM